jgi:hypothetical protein
MIGSGREGVVKEVSDLVDTFFTKACHRGDKQD